MAKKVMVKPWEDKWVVMEEGRKSPASTHNAKPAAVKRARSLAKRKKTVLTVYTQDHKVQTKSDYSK